MIKIEDFLILYGSPFKLLLKVIQKSFRVIFTFIQQFSSRYDLTRLYLVNFNMLHDDENRLLQRFLYYCPQIQRKDVAKSKGVTFSILISKAPILLFKPYPKWMEWLPLIRPGTFDLDFRNNPMDGWAWIELLNYLDNKQPDMELSHQRLNHYVENLMLRKKEKCYVFGTGRSLEKAINLDWEDGYKIVCNTIVRDPDLWAHIDPDFVVAGDAIYHFGFTNYARTFRRDLRLRLLSSRAMFAYPAQFHTIVWREFSDLEERLIPITVGSGKLIHNNLTRTFKLPNLGNVLGLLLLPLACTLSKNIFLWGFDGRAPDDKLFWSNSNKHSYPEYMEELQSAHPRFYEYYVPANDPDKYVRNNQGDALDVCLRSAENKGWKFMMMHSSWTETLHKRYKGDV